MRTVGSNEYHDKLAKALDDSAMAQQEYNNEFGLSLCLQYWAAPLNNNRVGSDKLPPGVIQLIHCMTEKCGTKGAETVCFCIKKVYNSNKVEEVQFFVTHHLKGKCPHRAYEEES